ncbi:MAG: ImmA/IrrE family metallo-endopeptidase [Muribaculaceae bacterium]|mgnify:FL=1|nr:ImmA/IrrE family metallo-endopeptidase [Muribaculaceae bacterium]
MENNKITFGKRLKQARQKEGLSMEELSRKTGGAVSKQTISKYESGMTMPGSDILGKLSSVLNVPMEYFFRQFAFDINGVQISFRKKSSVGSKEEAALRSQIQNKVEQYLELEKILSIETKQPSVGSSSAIINTERQMIDLAISIRNAWGIGNSPIENVKDELMRQGVKVFEIEGPDGFDGVSGAANETTWIIVLNKKKEHVERKRFTSFHEYGHLQANKLFEKTLSKHDKEKLCDAFASEMLLPSQVLLDLFAYKSKLSFKELVAVQVKYGISIDAIMFSLKRLGIVSDKRYRSYCIRKNMNKDFKNVVELSRFEEKDYNSKSDTERFNLMVYSALAQELISASKAAEMLECNVAVVNENSITI